MKFTSKMILSFYIFLSFHSISCVKNSDNGSTSQSSKTNMAQLIHSYEETGKWPKLDRSADIKGPDKDNNGIRDDIDLWIVQQNYAPPQKAAVEQTARAMQDTLLVDVSDKKRLQEVTDDGSRSIHCVYSLFDTKDADIILDSVEKFTVNTKVRFLVYGKYNAALNGGVFSTPLGETCDVQ